VALCYDNGGFSRAMKCSRGVVVSFQGLRMIVRAYDTSLCSEPFS